MQFRQEGFLSMLLHFEPSVGLTGSYPFTVLFNIV